MGGNHEAAYPIGAFGPVLGGGVNGLALCSGVGGLELGLQIALRDEYVCVGFIEARRVARASLVRNLAALGGRAAFGDDIRTHDFRRWSGCVDIVSAGWPCQGFSTASRGRPRHPDLWPFVRRAIVRTRAPWVFLENVNRAPWDVVEFQLSRLGFRCRRGRFCPSDLGAPHRRPRTFLLAYADREGKSLGSFDAEVARLSSPTGFDPEARSRALRMANGPPSRMDRFRLAGEGAIPLVAACAFRTLAERLAE